MQRKYMKEELNKQWPYIFHVYTCRKETLEGFSVYIWVAFECFYHSLYNPFMWYHIQRLVCFVCDHKLSGFISHSSTLVINSIIHD